MDRRTTRRKPWRARWASVRRGVQLCVLVSTNQVLEHTSHVRITPNGQTDCSGAHRAGRTVVPQRELSGDLDAEPVPRLEPKDIRIATPMR